MAKVTNRSGWFLAITIIGLFITFFLLFLSITNTYISLPLILLEIFVSALLAVIYRIKQKA